MLDAHEFKYESHDKIVDARCSRRRPDFVMDYNYFTIILKVDENQHHSYDSNPTRCRNGRCLCLI